jgi:hypothetical protein
VGFCGVHQLLNDPLRHGMEGDVKLSVTRCDGCSMQVPRKTSRLLRCA